jgi:hypothetical protein
MRCDMNITIAVDDKVVERARELARRQGRSLQELVRDYLQTLVGDRPGSEVADELLALMERHGGRSGGRRFHRSDAYEDRL